MGLADTTRVHAPRSATRSALVGDADSRIAEGAPVAEVASETPDEAVFRQLQGSAGNRAVAELMAIQRDPAPVEPADPVETVATRLKTARGRVDSTWLDPIAWDTFVEAGGTINAIAQRIWFDQLELLDVDPAALAGKDAASAKALETDLRQRVGKVLASHFTALRAEASGTAGKKRITDRTGEVFAEVPGWDAGDLTDRLFHEWAGPGRIRDLTGAAKEASAAFWTALNVGAAQALTARREQAFTSAEVAALDPAEVAAVRADLDGATAWIATADDTDALTDRVTPALRVPAARAAAPWKQLRGRMAQLIPVAEVGIIKDTIPQEKAVGPERWANLRGRWLATISKPIWRYWSDNIVDSTVFGHTVKRSEPGEGLHREVAEAMRRVEQSAHRLAPAGTDLATAEGAKGPVMRGKRAQPITQPGTEFRFEPLSHFDWMLKSQHLSFHGTGRAIDFRSATNPAVQGPAHELISVLGEGELSEQTIDRATLGRWANVLATLDNRRAALEAQLAETSDPDLQASLKLDIARFEGALADAPETHRTATALRDRATTVYTEIRRIETTFQAAWSEIETGATGKDGKVDQAALLTTLRDRVTAAKDSATTELAGLKTQAAALPPKDRSSLQSQMSVLDAKLDRIAKLDSALAAKGSGPAKVATEVAAVAQSGLNDLPDWLVQAFTEQGWSWGGSWVGFSDAMHFDYMGSVTDVIAQ
jgi:hypothetical protein